MDKIAHIHLEGPFIKAAKALIPEKPVSLGWNTQFHRYFWAFVFKGAPSERALNAAQKTGLHFQQHNDNFSTISLPDVKENEVEAATKRFDLFATEYKEVSKKTAAIINGYINEDAAIVKTIPVKTELKLCHFVGEKKMPSKRAQNSFSKYLFSTPASYGSEYYVLRIPKEASPPKENDTLNLNGAEVVVQSVRTPDDIAKSRGAPVARSMEENGIGWDVNCLPKGHRWLRAQGPRRQLMSITACIKQFALTLDLN